MRWKRLPKPLSTSRPVDFVASATSSMVIADPISVAISPILAALASGRSVTSIGKQVQGRARHDGTAIPADHGVQLAFWNAMIAESRRHVRARRTRPDVAL